MVDDNDINKNVRCKDGLGVLVDICDIPGRTMHDKYEVAIVKMAAGGEQSFPVDDVVVDR